MYTVVNVIYGLPAEKEEFFQKYSEEELEEMGFEFFYTGADYSIGYIGSKISSHNATSINWFSLSNYTPTDEQIKEAGEKIAKLSKEVFRDLTQLGWENEIPQIGVWTIYSAS